MGDIPSARPIEDVERNLQRPRDKVHEVNGLVVAMAAMTIKDYDGISLIANTTTIRARKQ